MAADTLKLSTSVHCAAGNGDLEAQREEMELLEAMSKEGEIEWEEVEAGSEQHEQEHGRTTIEGSLRVFQQLSGPVLVKADTSALFARTVFKDSHTKAKGNKLNATDSVHSRSSSNSSSSSQTIGGEVAGKSKAPLVVGVETAEVNHLPPICLHFQFPANYPSEAPPTFTLSCQWLNFTQLTSLCRELDRQWERDPSTVVMFKWQEFLRCEALSFLGLHHVAATAMSTSSPVPLSSENQIQLSFELPGSSDKWDSRAFQDVPHPRLMLQTLVEYDSREQERAFADSFFDCSVCFSSLPGSECVRLAQCGHTQCRECLTAHVGTKIQSGDVVNIGCPETDCKTIMDPGVIKDLVSGKAFDRYDKLLLQRSLDSMQDLVYCPRPACHCVTIKEADTQLATCPKCKFSFCVLCRKVWHGVSPCRLLPSDVEELRSTYESLDSSARKEMEKQYGRSNLGHAFQELDSHLWLKSNTKQCPHCEASIEKSFGCNKVTCTKCCLHFCWLCNDKLPRHNPYSHFRFGTTPCAGKLFDGMVEDDVVMEGWALQF